LNRACSINAGQQALACGLLVAGRSVYLPSEKQATHPGRFHCRVKLSRIDKVVFDSISGPNYAYILKAIDHSQQFELKVGRQ